MLERTKGQVNLYATMSVGAMLWDHLLLVEA